jgi:hypothetical protein
LDFDVPEILKDFDKFIEDFSSDLEKENNNDDAEIDNTETDGAKEDWDPNLAVEAYL